MGVTAVGDRRDKWPRTRRSRRSGGSGRGVAAMLGGVLAAGGVVAGAGAAASPADAVACSGQVRYASSSNTLYLGSGDVDLPRIAEICPAAPLSQVAPGTWFLRANLIVENGATLRVRGTAAGGTVNTLRLASPPSGRREDVVEITALWGTLDLRSVTVTSWDAATGGPDRDVTVPAALGSAGKGRAFIRAVSRMDGDVPRVSRMDVTDSDLGFLGYYGGEAYGVSLKARGCGKGAAARICDVLDVTGSQRGSRFHDNMMGTYTWGAVDMVFDGNVYERNIMYGLDPHDDSDRLTITGNRASRNGRHGIICSERCDRLTITGNTVEGNGIPPYSVNPEDPEPQVHGIMLHRGVTGSVVAGNVVSDHPNGAGIAVMDSSGNTVRGNTLTRNKYGLRVSVGSHDLRFEDNRVEDSGSYAVYAYPGERDTAVYGVPDGRPAAVSFSGTRIGGTGNHAVRLLGTDGFRFTGTTVAAGAGAIHLDGTRGFRWDGATMPPGGIVLRNRSTATVRTPGAFRSDVQAGSVLVTETPQARRNRHRGDPPQS